MIVILILIFCFRIFAILSIFRHEEVVFAGVFLPVAERYLAAVFVVRKVVINAAWVTVVVAA